MVAAEKDADYNGLDREVRFLRRRVGALERELQDKRESHAKAKEAKELFAYWAQATGHGRAALGPKRMKAVLAALQHHSLKDLEYAVDGCAAWPYVNHSGRAETGTSKERYDDIELICRDEIQVEKFMALARGLETCATCDRPRLRLELSFCRGCLS